jgi:hypothetical protein
MVRIPSAAVVKSVIFEAEAMGAGKFNLSVYYSDSTTDGTQPAKQGLIVPTTGDQFFASDIDCASAVDRIGKTNESGNYPVTKRNKPLWDALGLTVDPGGYFDIVAVVHTTDVTTGAANISVECEYVGFNRGVEGFKPSDFTYTAGASGGTDMELRWDDTKSLTRKDIANFLCALERLFEDRLFYTAAIGAVKPDL